MQEHKDNDERAVLIPLTSKQNAKKSCCKCCNWKHKTLWYFMIAILVVIFLAGFIQYFFIPKMIDDEAKQRVRNQVILKEEHMDGNHDPFNSWVNNTCLDCPAGYFSFYIYNMTNPEEVLYDSALPEFEELGPWVYRRFGYKKNIRFYDDESNSTKSRLVSYTNVADFVFQPELSISLDRFTSRIFTINFGLLGFFNTVNFGQGVGIILPDWDALMQTAPVESILYNSTVFKYLHGINNDMVESAPLVDANSTFFRLLALDENAVVEKTGEYHDSNCRELIIYENATVIETGHPLISMLIPHIWNRSDAFVVGCRETLQFPPFNSVGKNVNVNGNGVLKVWGTEKFRPVDYIFEKEVTHKGLKMNRYRISDDIWLNTTERPENKGYYLDYLPSGLINVTLVRGSPSMLSKGHFLGAPFYEENVNEKFNIKMILDDSDAEQDEQLVDIDPYTGIGFRQYHTYQINFHVIELNRPYNTSYTDANLSFWNDVIPFSRIVVRGGASDDTIEDVANAYKQIELYENLSFYGAILIPIVCFMLIAGIIYKMRKTSAVRSVHVDEWSRENHPDISLVDAAVDTLGYGTEIKPLS